MIMVKGWAFPMRVFPAAGRKADQVATCRRSWRGRTRRHSRYPRAHRRTKSVDSAHGPGAALCGGLYL